MQNTTDILTAEAVLRHLPDGWPAPLTVEDTLPSTNGALKEAGADGASEGTVRIARRQTAGRGRLGRSFYSPEQTGLYLSLLLRPTLPAEKALRITAAAALAGSLAVETVFGVAPGIKWVNDLYIQRKKVAGILTEAVFTPSGRMDFAVLGIGVNLTAPSGGFPEDIKDIAGAVLPAPVPEGRARLAAAFLTEFTRLYKDLGEESPAFLPAYRERCFFLGETVEVITPGEAYVAKALDIAEDLALVVRREDGGICHLHAGEIRIRLSKESPPLLFPEKRR